MCKKEEDEHLQQTTSVLVSEKTMWGKKRMNETNYVKKKSIKVT